MMVSIAVKCVMIVPASVCSTNSRSCHNHLVQVEVRDRQVVTSTIQRKISTTSYGKQNLLREIPFPPFACPLLYTVLL